MYSVFEYYSNNILFVFVFGHNSEPEYYSYSYSAKYLCTNIIRIRIRSFWKNEYYLYSYSVKIRIPNIIRIRIRSKKQFSLTSELRNVICLNLRLIFYWRNYGKRRAGVKCFFDLLILWDCREFPLELTPSRGRQRDHLFKLGYRWWKYILSYFSLDAFQIAK